MRGRERALVWDSLARLDDMALVADLLVTRLTCSSVTAMPTGIMSGASAGLAAAQAVIAHDDCRRRFEDDACPPRWRRCGRISWPLGRCPTGAAYGDLLEPAGRSTWAA
ncbi:MAG: hypothetical protein R2838_25870 [Caldilineaceae bacterium]